MSRQLHILITGGGTGGHVFPAIAIADAIKKLRPDTAFLFVGAQGKIEMERVPKAGYPIEGLNIAGFQRGFSLQSLLRNLSFPFKLIGSAWKAERIVRRFRPDAVVGTGGYASGPVMRTAQQLGIPTIIQEQNSYAGVTNRLLAKKAARICVAYDGMEQYFPADRLAFTGNPVRQDILDLTKKREEGLAFYGLDSGKKTIAVIGGSLGARTLNRALADNTELLAGQPDIQVLWQCGRFYEQAYTGCATAQLPNVQLRPFIDRMDLLYAAADLIVSRAGALAISELCLVGKPVVLVPSPNVAEDHQTKNAMALTEKNAARLVRDTEAVEILLPEVLSILKNEALMFSLGENIHHLGKPKAAELIANVVLELAAKPKMSNA